MVLHVARALDRVGVEVALELLEDLAVGLAHDVGEDVEPAAVGHAHHRLVHALVDGLVEDRVEDHDRRLRTFEAETLLPDVAGVEEALEDLGRVETVEDVALLLRVERGGDPLDVLLDPPLLVGVLDVHVLDAERPAVGVAEDVEDLVERRGLPAGEPVGDELARQVPDGEAVVERVELGVELGRLGVERVEVGDQVAPYPVHVDERLHVDLLRHLQPAPVVAEPRIGVPLPAHRLVGNGERLEDLVVEAVPTGETLATRSRGRAPTRRPG